jgi:hypothetical protein
LYPSLQSDVGPTSVNGRLWRWFDVECQRWPVVISERHTRLIHPNVCVYTKCYKLGDGLLCGYTRKMLDYTDLTSAQQSNIPSEQMCCRPMHSIWTLDIGRETIGNKTLQRGANVEPINRANVDPMSKMTTGQRWHSTSNQRQRRPLTDVGPTSLCVGPTSNQYNPTSFLYNHKANHHLICNI